MKSRGPSSLMNSEAVKVPGPGAYASDNATVDASKYPTSPRFAFGTAPRDQVTCKKLGTTIPGPGAYTPRDVELPSATRCAFGRSNRTSIADKTNDSPGPGSYSLSRSLGGPSYSTGSRRDGPRSTRPREPGPGQYASPTASAVSGHEAAPSWGFGTSQRPPIGSSGFTSARRTEADSSRGPGPGTYEAGSCIGPKTSSSAPRFTMRQRRRSSKKRS
ncbi:conserved hypothetical protein [Perkinsus marinus ATCC 50983]|uniref:Uncharacterized protein n=1 Tax=Perkinsus marinus (strain ATCC 50983 / TXsc) TaxID=423536 RepID=C5LAF5_PERM5|nr:conserved hypothetical protein [Perkinsus marinus ATCC 50983]EER06411.1 conserved hypothetical protein [Perkinsus marinus ATCC 50983]|eukprot:XP_002774595.1 conserved hypothetical protein [Perkinsus marinus ATCC 50983]